MADSNLSSQSPGGTETHPPSRNNAADTLRDNVVMTGCPISHPVAQFRPTADYLAGVDALPEQLPAGPILPRPVVTDIPRLDSFIITVEFRSDPSQGLSDSPQAVRSTPATLLLEDQYYILPPPLLRLHYLSWAKFHIFVEEEFGIPFTATTCELGYTVLPPRVGLPTEYYKITNEIAFQCAIGVKMSEVAEGWGDYKLTFYLWSPPPTEHPFRRSRRARQPAQDPITGGVSTTRGDVPPRLEPADSKPLAGLGSGASPGRA